MKKMKKFAALLLAVSMAAGMVACGSSDKKEETTKKEETKKDDKETKKLEGTLKVVTTGDAYQPLFDKFTEEVGPKVEFISMSSGEVLSKLKAEGGTPAADLWFGGGIDAFMDAKDNNLLKNIKIALTGDDMREGLTAVVSVAIVELSVKLSAETIELAEVVMLVLTKAALNNVIIFLRNFIYTIL